MMKPNIAGGPSIIFNRYAKCDETFIRGGPKLCKKVIGYDANALYLWALGNEMPRGRLTSIVAYDGIIDDITNDKIFGFLQCDIETPEHHKDYFGEMTPIFKNVEIDPCNKDLIGDHMYSYNLSRKPHNATKSRKLIGSYFGKQILIYTPLLKWYLQHGLVVTEAHSFVKANSNKTFKGFMEKVSDARREGDVDSSKSVLAKMMKLIGNSAFGRSGMDKSKHLDVKYATDEEKFGQMMHHFTFHSHEELNGVYEVSKQKRSIKFNNPIHLSIAIYQLTKLRMLQFYYDMIDFYIDRSDFEYQEMNTDSAYIAFSDDHPFETLIKPELRDHYKQHKYDWFPRDFNHEVAKFGKRTPGLYKEEWRGDITISLSSKNYICYLPDTKHKQKISAKGVQQARNPNGNILNPAGFEEVIANRVTLSATNKGFRIDKSRTAIVTYTQDKVGLSYFYDERKLLSDLYYNPKTGFVGVQKPYEKAKSIDRKITLRAVREWYSKQEDTRRFQEQPNNFDDFKIVSLNPNSWKMDLTFWEQQPILTAININSRIGFARLLADKRGPTVLSALKYFIKHNKVNILTTDNGSEFMNDLAQKFFKDKGIDHFNNEAGGHKTTDKIERFNRTIKQRFIRLRQKLTQGSLEDFIENYNNTYHRSIVATPNQRKGQVIQAELQHNQDVSNEITRNFAIGDNVRYRLERKQFAKESLTGFSFVEPTASHSSEAADFVCSVAACNAIYQFIRSLNIEDECRVTSSVFLQSGIIDPLAAAPGCNYSAVWSGSGSYWNDTVGYDASSAPSASSNTSASMAAVTIVSITVGVLLAFVVAVIAVVWYKRQRLRVLHRAYGNPFLKRGASHDSLGDARDTGLTQQPQQQYSQGGTLWSDDELLALHMRAEDIDDTRVIGHGVVYFVQYRQGRLFASKRLVRDHITRTKTRELITEIKLVAKLGHPCIVQFVGAAWTTETNLQALFEFMPNGDLCTYLAKTCREDGGEPWNLMKLQIAMDTVEALVYVHSFAPPLVHRDLKSRNVLLSEDMRGKLSDFGVSRYQSDNCMATGVGTSRWLAPEVMASGGEYNQSCDIYSTGMMLAELDSHRLPFSEVRMPSRNPMPEMSALQLVSQGKLTPTFSASYPESLRAIALRCVAFDPRDRPNAIKVSYVLRTIAKKDFGL